MMVINPARGQDPVEWAKPGHIPSNMCQPPVHIRALVNQLTEKEVREVLIAAAIWAPEIFERGLRSMSEDRILCPKFHHLSRSASCER